MWRNIMEKADGIAKDDMKFAYLDGAKNELEQALEKCFEISEMLKICIKDIKNLQQKKNDIEDDTKKDFGGMYLTGQMHALMFAMEVLGRQEALVDKFFECERERACLGWIDDIEEEGMRNKYNNSLFFL